MPPENSTCFRTSKVKYYCNEPIFQVTLQHYIQGVICVGELGKEYDLTSFTLAELIMKNERSTFINCAGCNKLREVYSTAFRAGKNNSPSWSIGKD